MRGASIVTLLVATGCSSTSPCDASLCDGCCDKNGVCLAGKAIAACGAGGVACRSCATDNICLGGACVATTSCARREDCTANQCRCGDGAKVDARDCKMGRCLSSTEVCDGACVSAGHPRPGTGGDGGTPGYSFCVDGTASSCFGAELDWSNNQCCVTVGYGQCVTGTAAACFGSDLEWTGSTCCVKTAYGPCVDGNAIACTGDAMEWTGLQCCVKGPFYLCVAGNEQNCGGTDLTWTGSKCCAAAEFNVCTEGTVVGCTGANLRWTGEACCVRGRTSCVDGAEISCTGDWTGSKCCT